MTRVLWFPVLILTACASSSPPKADAPAPLVSIADVDPTIRHDIRYAGNHNFIGRPIAGYAAPKCLLTKEAAAALKDVQAELKPKGLSLKVYDCYRPQRGVNDFIAWAKDEADQKTKREFYPQLEKKEIFPKGYVSSKSGHTRGSTVDLTVVKIGGFPAAPYKDGDRLVPCTEPVGKRYGDDSIDMGTGYDCFDARAATASPGIPKVAKANREILRGAMDRHGFKNYEGEWWHYTLRNEPFPDTYFDVPVQ